MSRPALRIIAPAALLALAAPGVLAQDLGENAPTPDQANVVNNGFVYNDSVFNQWVFGGNGTAYSSGRDRLDALLNLRLADVERSCPLTEAQRRKLLLAGRGDVKRFDDRLAEARAVFDRLKADQNRVQEILQMTQPLAAEFRAGLFGEGSLFAKALAATLDPEQAARHAEALREKRRFQFKAKVLAAVANLDARGVGLSSEQSRRLADVVLREAPLPLQFGDQYDNFVVMVSIARLPEAKLRPIFANAQWPDRAEAQWQAFSAQIQQGRNMERFLETNGYIAPAAKPADAVAVPKPAAPQRPEERP